MTLDRCWFKEKTFVYLIKGMSDHPLKQVYEEKKELIVYFCIKTMFFRTTLHQKRFHWPCFADFEPLWDLWSTVPACPHRPTVQHQIRVPLTTVIVTTHYYHPPPLSRFPFISLLAWHWHARLQAFLPRTISRPSVTWQSEYSPVERILLENEVTYEMCEAG